jgi:hypothetical protein
MLFAYKQVTANKTGFFNRDQYISVKIKWQIMSLSVFGRVDWYTAGVSGMHIWGGFFVYVP